MTPQLLAAERWIQGHMGRTVVAQRPVSGGCINQNVLLELDDGQRLFLKANAGVHEDFFLAESQALERASRTRTFITPTTLAVDENWLLMEALVAREPEEDDWAQLGETLAALHRNTSTTFGLDGISFCGLTRLDNTPDTDGWRFFSERRLWPLARQAHERNLLPRWALQALETLTTQLPELIPEQPASLLHGDFWRGNVFFCDRGPAYIDPAQYYGWREADLAMSRLFGLLSPAFYAAYNAAWPLEPGFESRSDLYNLFHLLNHVVLFGAGYTPSVLAILRPFRHD